MGEYTKYDRLREAREKADDLNTTLNACKSDDKIQ
jgi:hypothetical protein